MAELVGIALLAFRNGHYHDAASLFEQVLAQDPNDWIARLYLGLSYSKIEQHADAYRHLTQIAIGCSDEDVRARAINALHQLNALTRFQQGKPDEEPPDAEAIGGN